jgi:hypothetical protein
MIQDAQGHHLSGATTETAAAYDQAVRAFNLVHGDSIGLFDKGTRGSTRLRDGASGKGLGACHRQ